MNRTQQDRDAKRKKRKKSIKPLVVVVGVLGICVLILVIMCLRAKHRLYSEAASLAPQLTTSENAVSGNYAEALAEVYWEEGWVRYNGKIYEYNDDILTFLVMGIDEFGVVQESTDGVSGGQADALILAVLDGASKKISLIAINRDTMTDVLMYGYGSGDYIEAQIAVQHGFGDGMELSCELTRDAVSRLFYDLPIHGYVSVNMGVIPQLNDAVGGVSVVIPEDVAGDFEGWNEGETVALYGIEAFYFVQQRDCESFDSNSTRLSRQKQYLTAFVNTLLTQTAQDLTLPVDVYLELQEYMVTDISTDEMAYLAGEVISYSFEDGSIYTLEGTTQMGENFEEFYVDHEALKALMIDIFYREVENTGN
ncbi:MAG: LytR family transcriptional regulator [Lachnospiraceae bacterium]|nr:LytR family transcriptional regulator [Lachnospiraceae bacterium]